jgi:hypothetical protein
LAGFSAACGQTHEREQHPADRRRQRPPITTDSRHSHAIAPNRLDQRFDIDRPDAVWLADIS